MPLEEVEYALHVRHLLPHVVRVVAGRVNRSVRRGLGRAILEHLEAAARQHGSRTLRLDTTAVQVVAQQLFRTAGYEEVDRKPSPVGDELIIFEKDLRGASRPK